MLTGSVLTRPARRLKHPANSVESDDSDFRVGRHDITCGSDGVTNALLVRPTNILTLHADITLRALFILFT